jgi:hypothetical protein
MTNQRIGTFQEFWPYYLNEHQKSKCRHLHFIGTSGFVLLLLSQIFFVFPQMIAAVGIGLGIAHVLFEQEGKRNAFWILLTMIVLMAVASPVILGGVLFAYFWAWIGHFMIEHNRPASFVYPLWSLTADFKMWIEMLKGHFWQENCPEFQKQAQQVQSI